MSGTKTDRLCFAEWSERTEAWRIRERVLASGTPPADENERSHAEGAKATHPALLRRLSSSPIGGGKA